MDKRIAQRLGRLLAGEHDGGDSSVLGRWPMRGGKLKDFHKWTDNQSSVGAYLLCSPPRDPFWLVISDWRGAGSYYFTLFPHSRSGPYAEIHRQVSGPNGIFLAWQYRPSLRDGQNEKRHAYFEQAFGSRDVQLEIPFSRDEIPNFIESLAYLIECRVKADLLAEDLPVTQGGFTEGRLVERRHLARERNLVLINHAKKRALEASGHLCCACCGFDFKRAYGEVGEGFIEAHHIKPLSTLTSDTTVTTVEDIVLVCSNCHRMLHRRRPWLGIDQLRTLLVDG